MPTTMSEAELEDYKKKVDPPFHLNGCGLIPMTQDISLFSWYGFLLFFGFKKCRDVRAIAMSDTGRYVWVEDTHTKRSFIQNLNDGRLIQFSQNDLRVWGWKRL